MNFKSNEILMNIAKPIADSVGVEIIEIETKNVGEPHLTFFIDKEDGVDLNTCEKFHNAINAVLDEEDVSFGASYTLNVSSPGLDRPLKTKSDFERNVGNLVEIKLYAPMKGKKFFEGYLTGFDENTVTVEFENNEIIKFEIKKIAKMNQAITFE